MSPLKAIFIAGTSHEAYQIRPRCGPHDGADAFKQYVLQTVRTHAVQTVAEEMSVEGLLGRRTVCDEVAEEENLSHILCDPTRSEREALNISKDNTPSDDKKRETEWLRRLVQSCRFPVLFVCGANHVCSFAQLCRDEGLVPTVVNRDFEAPDIPLDMFRLNVHNETPGVAWVREHKDGIATVEAADGVFTFRIIEPGQTKLEVIDRSLGLGTWGRTPTRLYGWY